MRMDRRRYDAHNLEHTPQDGAIADHAARCAALYLLVAAHSSAPLCTNPFLSYLLEVRGVGLRAGATSNTKHGTLSAYDCLFGTCATLWQFVVARQADQSWEGGSQRGGAAFERAALHLRVFSQTDGLVAALPQAATDAQRPQAERAFLCRLLTGSAQVGAAVLRLSFAGTARSLPAAPNLAGLHLTDRTLDD